MAISPVFPLRIAQGIFALAILGTSCYVVNWYDTETFTAPPSQINFLIFLPLFSFLSIAYLQLVPTLFPQASHPYAHLTLESLNTIFYFAGFIALANFLSRLLFCRGSVCSAARADAVIAAVGWMLWMASTSILVIELGVFNYRSKGEETEKGQQTKKAPAAAQLASTPETRVV